MSSNALVNDVSLSSRPRYDISARQFESHPLRQHVSGLFLSILHEMARGRFSLPSLLPLRGILRDSVISQDQSHPSDIFE